MRQTAHRIRRVLAAVILVTTALFVVAVVLERGQPEPAPSLTEEGHREETEGHSEAGEQGREQAAQHGEGRMLGLDLESPAVVGVVAIVSLAMAAAIVLFDKRGVLIVVALAMVTFALFDVRELVAQIREHHTAVAVAAAAVGVGHLAAGALAMMASRATAE
jgi:hypothetical protein